MIWLSGSCRRSNDNRLCATIWQAGKVAGCERGCKFNNVSHCQPLPAFHPALTPLKGPSTDTPLPFGPWPPVPYLGVLARGCGRSAPDPPPAPSLERAGPGGPASELPPTAQRHHRHHQSSAQLNISLYQHMLFYESTVGRFSSSSVSMLY